MHLYLIVVNIVIEHLIIWKKNRGTNISVGQKIGWTNCCHLVANFCLIRYIIQIYSFNALAMCTLKFLSKDIVTLAVVGDWCKS